MGEQNVEKALKIDGGGLRIYILLPSTYMPRPKQYLHVFT